MCVLPNYVCVCVCLCVCDWESELHVCACANPSRRVLITDICACMYIRVDMLILHNCMYVLQNKDAGDYKCVATNDAGSSEGIATLTVRSRSSCHRCFVSFCR